jgi:hypothetical protein
MNGFNHGLPGWARIGVVGSGSWVNRPQSKIQNRKSKIGAAKSGVTFGPLKTNQDAREAALWCRRPACLPVLG